MTYLSNSDVNKRHNMLSWKKMLLVIKRIGLLIHKSVNLTHLTRFGSYSHESSPKRPR